MFADYITKSTKRLTPFARRGMQQFKLHLNLARLINNKTDVWTCPLTGLVAPAAALQLHPQNLPKFA